jgi:tetratricopeptide (TPR) repeat protein
MLVLFFLAASLFSELTLGADAVDLANTLSIKPEGKAGSRLSHAPQGGDTGADSRAAAARARDAYARALELEKRGKHAAALLLLWEAAGLAPRDPDIHNQLGEALQRMGALDAAIDAYHRALSQRPSFRRAENNLILTLVAAGRGPEAVTRARALTNASPNDPESHFTLGLAQSEQDVEGAIGSFKRAVELAPQHALAHYNLGLVLKRADRLQEAVDELRRAIDVAPQAEAHYTLGVLYWHQADLERAAGSLREAIKANPEYADAHHTLGAVLLMQGESKAAITSLRRALELRPDLWAAHHTLGRALQRSGDLAAARIHVAEAERLRELARLRQEAGVWTATGTRKLEAGDADGALDHFRRAIQIFEGSAPTHYQLGRALQRLGRHDAARAAFGRAQQLNPALVPPPDLR